MAKIEFEGFVNEQVGNPVFVLKVAENHRKKTADGGYENAGKTFFDVKVGRDSGIDLGSVPVDSRVKIVGRQLTEVREYQGKKFYTLTVWADRIEPAQSQNGAGGPQNSRGTQSPTAGWNSPQNTDAASFGGGLGDQFSAENPPF